MIAVVRPVVLVYHGVGPPEGDPNKLLVSLEHLEAHIRLLQRLGYRFLTAEELLDEGGPPRPRTAVITFDDGFRSWLTEVAPLFARLGVRGTFYVCPGLFGRTHWDVDGEAGRLLDQDDARALVEAGMELGAHSQTHADLLLVDERELAFELSESRTAVERITGRPCRTMAYPYGLHDERVTEAAAEAGYELAFAWLPGPWRQLAAPRLPAPPRHGALRLALRLAGIRRRGRR